MDALARVPADRKADRHVRRRMHVHRLDWCQYCLVPLDCYCHSGGHRQAKYCSDAHRQAAYRERLGAEQ